MAEFARDFLRIKRICECDFGVYAQRLDDVPSVWAGIDAPNPMIQHRGRVRRKQSSVKLALAIWLSMAGTPPHRQEAC